MRALIFLNDSPTELINKGEILNGYFNPNYIFSEIDYVISVEGARDSEALQAMSGLANIRVYYLNNPRPFFIWSLGWARFRLKSVARKLMKSAWFIQPTIIRCVNPFVESGIAVSLAKLTGLPLVVSVHGTYDRDPIRPGNLVDRILNPFRQRLYRWVLESATRVVGVYEDATNFAQRQGAKDLVTIYNELNVVKKTVSAPRKTLSGDVRIVCINRQDSMKDPSNIIRAVAQDPELFFTLVGDGPIHPEILNLISELDVSERVKCITAIPNTEWIEILSKSDLYVSHCDYAGISKGVLEAALIGIPIVINRNDPLAPEYSKGWVSLCDGTSNGYLLNIHELISNQVLRDQIRTKALEFSSEMCLPKNVRSMWQQVYFEVSKK